MTADQPREVVSGRSAARQKGSGVRVASIPAMIGRMRRRGHGASTPNAAAGSRRRRARFSVVALAAALAGCSAARVLASTTIPSFGTTSMIHAGGGLWFATSAGEVIVAPPLMVRLFLARARGHV